MISPTSNQRIVLPTGRTTTRQSSLTWLRTACSGEPSLGDKPWLKLDNFKSNIKENNVSLKLTIVETAGFGDQLDKDASATIISQYIDKQFKSYLDEEMKIKRSLQFCNDSRIHACIYFISPTGHGLKALDVTVLRLLSTKVNIIPVIAKADTISKDELKRFKTKILNDLSTHGITLYHFPMDDENVAGVNSAFNSMVPFAVIGSLDTVPKGSKKVRARIYPWGVVEIENEEHCDFVKLREALLRTNVEDLRQRTHEILYEDYRRDRLTSMGFKEGDLGAGIQKTYKEKLELHKSTLQSKEQQLRDTFMVKAQKCEDELRRREQELVDAISRGKTGYEEEIRNLAERERNIDRERADFERQKEGYSATLGRRKK